MPTSTPQPRRLLIRGVNWLGDAIMTTPALLRLREALPQAHLSLLTPRKLADLWRYHPALDGVIPFESGEGLWKIARRLRRGSFEAALVLPNSPRAALEVWLAGIPLRVGYARPWRTWLLTRAIQPDAGQVAMRKRSTREIRRLVTVPPAGSAPLPADSHHLHHYLHLVASLGAHPEPLRPHLEVRPSEVEAVCQKFAGLDALAAEGPLFGLNPGAEYGPAKRWPQDRFIAAAIELQIRTRCRWWVFGGKADQSLADQIVAAVQQANPARASAVRSLAGQTSLRELCAALKACHLVLTNDTGPMHVAAAVGTPVVVPFGSTSPELTGPGLPADPRHRLLRPNAPCSPCFRRACPIDFRCMTSVTVARVVETVLQTWRASARSEITL